jgi:hypothetical protein
MDTRLAELERETHTLRHRVTVLEDTHRETPHRLTRVEMVLDRLPDLERQIVEQGDLIRRGFLMTHGFLIGAGAVWIVFQAGPEVLKFLGAK